MYDFYNSDTDVQTAVNELAAAANKGELYIIADEAIYDGSHQPIDMLDDGQDLQYRDTIILCEGPRDNLTVVSRLRARGLPVRVVTSRNGEAAIRDVALSALFCNSESTCIFTSMDDILLEPVSKATIRQKYFDWTTVKVMPGNYYFSSSFFFFFCVSRYRTLSVPTLPTTADEYVDPDHQPAQPTVVVSGGTRYEGETPQSSQRFGDTYKTRTRVCVRGRKTDMASILEMTVDYLKIVNSKLPTEFHAHVSHGGDPLVGRDGTPAENFLCASTQSRITRVLGRPTMVYTCVYHY
nr:hypothetical protein BaRGS_034630 [Batillaria attramentaria]